MLGFHLPGPVHVLPAAVAAAVLAVVGCGQADAAPTYTPLPSDYLNAFAGNTNPYSLDLFKDYAATYQVARSLDGTTPTRADFESFVLQVARQNGKTYLRDVQQQVYLGDLAWQQLRETARRYDQGDRSDWILRITEPADEAEAETACWLSWMATRNTMSTIMWQYFTAPECPALFGEYVASGESPYRGYLDWVALRMLGGGMWPPR